MIPPEQVEQIKKQLLTQIENFPAEKKEEAKKQIESMNEEQLEQFLIKNNLVKNSENSTDSPLQEQQCIFCSILEGKIPSYKIDENKDSIAILEINPISKLHSLIIPKKHLESGEQLPASAFSLAKKIAKKIKTKFKPQEVTISSANLFGHEIINILPIYQGETQNSERKKADESELLELQKILSKKPVIKKIKTKKLNPKQKLWLPKIMP